MRCATQSAISQYRQILPSVYLSIIFPDHHPLNLQNLYLHSDKSLLATSCPLSARFVRAIHVHVNDANDLLLLHLNTTLLIRLDTSYYKRLCGDLHLPDEPCRPFPCPLRRQTCHGKEVVRSSSPKTIHRHCRETSRGAKDEGGCRC